eukprot:Rhum_TRINITY_DN14764_c16_g3::Rhum_TRINITY_DN14764_c16_g3_i1::g.116164::m.116164
MVSVPWIVVIVVSTVALAALIMLCFIVPEWRRRVRELKEKVARSGEKLKYQEKRHQRRLAHMAEQQQQQQQPESDRQQRAAAAVPVQQQDQQQLHPRYERREAPHTRAASPAGSASLCDLSTITKDVSQQRLENDSPFAHAGGTAAAAAGYSPDAGKNPLSDLRQQGSGGGGGSKGAQAAASMQGRQKATSVKGAGVPAAAPSKAQQRSRVYFVVRVHRAPGAHSANHARKYSYSEEPSPSPAQQAAESAADGDGACIRLVPDRPFRTLFNHAALKKYATHVFGMEGGPVRYPIIRGEYEVFVVLRSEGELQAGVQHSGGGGGG